MSHGLLGAAGMTEFLKNPISPSSSPGRFHLSSHNLCGTDGLKIHEKQEGRKALCCSQLLVHQFYGLDWGKHQNPFFSWKRFPAKLGGISRSIPSCFSFSVLLQIFFPLVLSGLTLFPLPPPIYPRKWGCLGIQWEEGRSCWLFIQRLLGGSGGASLLFNGIEE